MAIAIPVDQVEVDSDDEDELPQASAASSSAATSFVDDVRRGTIDGSKPESASIALPRGGDAFIAAGGAERYVAECHELYRCDEPLLALRRLLLVERLVGDAGLPPLRERAQEDDRIALILRTETELEPMLRTILGDGWTLISPSSGKLHVETWLSLREGGRAAVKVTGVIPHAMSAVAAPLLFPELYHTWLPGITSGTSLLKNSNFRRLVHLKLIKLPVPFLSARDALVSGYGDIYSPTSAVVYLTSVEDNDPRLKPARAAIDKASPPGSTVRIGLHGGFVFETLPPRTPGEAPRTRLQTTLEFDLKLKIVPPQVALPPPPRLCSALSRPLRLAQLARARHGARPRRACALSPSRASAASARARVCS